MHRLRELDRNHMTARAGLVLAAVTAVISGFSVFVNASAVRAFDDPVVFTTLKNGVAAVILVALLVARSQPDPGDKPTVAEQATLGSPGAGTGLEVAAGSSLSVPLARMGHLMSVGSLIRGFCHELNNELGPVQGYAELLCSDTRLSELHRRQIARADVTPAAKGAGKFQIGNNLLQQRQILAVDLILQRHVGGADHQRFALRPPDGDARYQVRQRFADAGRPKKNERADRPVLVLQAGA